MKNIRFYSIALAMLALGMTSCDKEQNAPYSEDGNVYLTVTSSATGTRVSGEKDNMWDGNEEIGLYSTDLSATNHKFINEENGATSKFAPATEDDKIMIPAGAGSYEVSAYYPYSAEATPDAVKYDLNKVGAQPILHAEVANVSRENPNAAFGFKHLLGKLIVNIKAEEGVVISDDLSVTLKDAETMLTLNPVDGTLKADTDLASLTLKRVEGENTFYSFVMPKVGAADRVLTIINGDKTYSAKIKHEIKANSRHTFNVTLKADKADVNDGGSSIEGSEEGGTDDVSGEPETPATPTAITLGGDLTDVAGTQVMNVVADGATKNVEVNVADGQAFKVSTDADWVTLKTPTLRAAVEGTSASNVGVVVAANESSEAREATVTITSEGQDAVSFTIKQEGKKEDTPEEIVITPAETAINILSDATSATLNVDVTPAGTEWSVASSENWLVVEKDNDTTITYSADENTGEERTATITITAGEQTATIAVTQAKKVDTPATNELYPNGFDGKVEVGTVRGVTSTIESGKGMNGGDAISVTGTSTKNDYSFEFKVPENMPEAPTKITFWIKGTSENKSMSVVNKKDTENGFKLATIVNEAVTLTYERLKYDGSIEATDWVKVTLNLTSAGDVFQNLKAGEELFWFKTGKDGTYEILISDFEVF